MPKPKYIVNAENREDAREADKIRSQEKESYAEARSPGTDHPANQAPGAKIPGSDTEPDNPVPTPEAGPESEA